MTPEQINIAIAQACGKPTKDRWYCPSCYQEIAGPPMPGNTNLDKDTCDHQWAEKEYAADYCNDLNAMACAATFMRERSRAEYLEYGCILSSVVARDNSQPNKLDKESINTADATARQRAEAFLRTVDLWKE